MRARFPVCVIEDIAAMEAEGDFILISDLFSLSASCQFT
jgi:hypothetical protein